MDFNKYVLFFILAIIFFVVILLAIGSSSDKQIADSDARQVDDDYLRATMSRRDYYRNVYLRSEDWKRKRYVVLKRDKFCCVHCGAPATDVHHERYARKIGTEPIHWLVAICRPCHVKIHNH